MVERQVDEVMVILAAAPVADQADRVVVPVGQAVDRSACSAWPAEQLAKAPPRGGSGAGPTRPFARWPAHKSVGLLGDGMPP